jgi:L-threonylcarbamoyladenylate synthase
MQAQIIPATDPNAIPHALDVIRNGGLVAFPTDTVYGLAAQVFDPVSAARLYVAKGRSSNKAIAVLMSSAQELELVTETPSPKIQRVAEHFFPGPITLVVPKHPNIPRVVSSLPTVGVRIPDHPVALALLRAAGPLAVTSANRSGRDNAMTAEDVLEQLNHRIHLILDGGRSPGGVPSTVVDCMTDPPTILRQGPISLDDLMEVWNSPQ